MSNHALFLVLAALLGACGAAERADPPSVVHAQPVAAASTAQVDREDPPNVFRQRAPSHPYAEPEAVAHVVIYRTEYLGEVRVTRNGQWMRTDLQRDGADLAEISDLSAGVSFMLVRPAGHEAPTSINAERSRVDQDYYAFERIDTGRTDRVLGEPCRVIAWRRISANPSEARWASCITYDGIELWGGFERDGSVNEMQRATRIERRRVLVREIAPPPELLRWSTWRARADVLRGSSDSDYRIEMASPSGPATTRSVRKHGGWMYTDTRQEGGRRNFALTNGGLSVRYGEETPGEPDRIDIHFSAAPVAEQPIAGARTPLADRAPEQIAGESCAWFETGRTSHSRSLACITADDVVLHDVYQGDGVRGGRPWAVRATQFVRAPLSERAVEPPPEVFAWLERYAR